MIKIFINYRRADSAAYAGRLYDRLSARYSRNQIFFDVQSQMPPGVDWIKYIQEKLLLCDIVLVIIGESWLTVSDGQGRQRIFLADDPVRGEIVSALRHNMPVVPILLDKATMPSRDGLPDELKDLPRRNAVRITHENFESDFNRLIEFLEDSILSININKAEGHFFRGEYNSAIEQYTYILQHDPKNADVWLKLGRTYEKEGKDLKLAVQAYERAITINDAFHDAWYRLSCLQERLHNVAMVGHYGRAYPSLKQEARELMDSVQTGGLIAARAAVGENFYPDFQDQLINALKRGASIKLMLCDIRNISALEQRSLQLTKNKSLITKLKEQLHISAGYIKFFFDQARDLPGQLEVRTYNAPFMITCAQTIIVPQAIEIDSESANNDMFKEGTLYFVPYSGHLGSDLIVYKYKYLEIDSDFLPFVHYYNLFFQVWNHPSTRPFDIG